MAAARGRLSLLLLLFISGLTQSITKAPTSSPPNDHLLPQHAPTLQPKVLSWSNSTRTNQLDIGRLPANPSGNRMIAPRGLDNSLQKRQNICNDPDATCSNNDLCCTDTAQNTGWCCYTTLACDLGGQACTTASLEFTFASDIITSQSTVYVLYDSTSIDTEYVTETVTNTYVVTATDIATATEVEVTTLSFEVAGKVRRSLANDIANPQSGRSLIASSTIPMITFAARPKQGSSEKVSVIASTESVHYLARRQAETTTIILYSTDSEMPTLLVASVSDSTEYSTTTVTEVNTSTLALGAQTTVHVTSTYIVTGSSSASSSGTSSSDSAPTGTASSNDKSTSRWGGLSSEAAAGIAIGAAAGALLLAGVVALYVHRHRQQKQTGASMGGPPPRCDPSLTLPGSDNNHTDKLAPSAVDDPASRPVSSLPAYDILPHGSDQQIYHEVDGRMID